LPHAGALRRVLKVGGLELFLAHVERQGQFFRIDRINQLRGDYVGP
jgi:hypothetical protein